MVQYEKIKLLSSVHTLFLVASLPGRNQLRDQVLVPLQLLREKRKQVQPQLLLQRICHLLLTQLVVELVGQGLSCVQSMLG